jgi:hypothetical protein
VIPLEKLFLDMKLQPSAARALYRFSGMGSLPDAGVGTVSRHGAVMLLLGDMLIQSGIAIEQVYLILSEVREPAGKYVEARKILSNPMWAVQLIDGTYLCWPGGQHPFNYRTGEYEDKLPALPLHSTAYSVSGLLERIVEPLDRGLDSQV